MSHLHKGRLAQINDQVEDLKKERNPEETAKALDAATESTSAETLASSTKAKRSRKRK